MLRSNYLWILVFGIFIAACEQEPEGPTPIKPGTMELASNEILSQAPDLILNPTGLTPLAALARIQGKEAVVVQYDLLGEKPLTKNFETLDVNHSLPILGLRAGRSNTMVLTYTREDGYFAKDTFEVSMPSLPDYLPEIDILKADVNQMEPGMNLSELNLGSDGTFRTQPIIFDETGEIRWFIKLDFTGDWTAPFEPMANGNFLFGRSNRVFEFDMLGQNINEWSFDGYGQHHDAIEKPNGNIVVSVSKWSQDKGLDYFIELDRASGNIIREWDLKDILDVDRYELIFSEYDWIHVNSVWFDDRDESLLISGRHQGLIKTSADNELEWIIAPHRGWGQAGNNGDGHETSDFLLTAVDANGVPYPEEVQMGEERADDFDWPWGQHAAMLLPNGNIFVFDNGWRRQFQSSTLNGYSRGVEYEVDPVNKTVKQIWQYGQERGLEIRSGSISDVDLLPETGNRLICPGNLVDGVKSGKVIEVTYPSGEVVFEATIVYKNATSTGGGWGSADLVYRSERVKLYQK